MTSAPAGRTWSSAVSVLLYHTLGIRTFAALVLMQLVLLTLPSAMMNAQQVPATGALAGRVIADSTSRPVAGAMIAIGETGRSAQSDSAGLFTAVGIPSGIHIVRVRALGFAPFEQRIRFDSGQRVDVDVALTVLPQTLAGVNVVARPVPSFLKDFDARRRTGMGRFLDTTDIAPYANSQLATLLSSRVPGVRQVRFGGRTALASSRGNASLKEIPGGDTMDRQLGAPRACYVQIVIDNITLYQGQVDEPLFNADHVNLQAIAAIEFYTVANRPSEFKRAGGGACGTVVIWTKR